MSFQWIIDNAESISIDTKQVVGQTITRDGTVRSTGRGGQVWKFTVKMPDGPSWSENRGNIAKIEALDRTTTANIQINNSGQSWMVKYQGNAANAAAITATVPSSGNTITLTGGQAASGYNFRAGDIIQLGSTGHVYKVSADVASGNNTVTLNRPIIDSAGNVTLKVGPACTWNVVCTTFPNWNIFARDQVSWDAPFVFYENLV